jgi:hypothetical protein
VLQLRGACFAWPQILVHTDTGGPCFAWHNTESLVVVHLQQQNGNNRMEVEETRYGNHALPNVTCNLAILAHALLGIILSQWQWTYLCLAQHREWSGPRFAWHSTDNSGPCFAWLNADTHKVVDHALPGTTQIVVAWVWQGNRRAWHGSSNRQTTFVV